MQKLTTCFKDIHAGLDGDFGRHDLEDTDSEICLQSSLSMTAQLLLLGKCQNLPKPVEITLQKLINLVFLFIHIAEVIVEGVPLAFYGSAVSLISLCTKDGKFDGEAQAALGDAAFNTLKAVKKTAEMLFS